MHRFHSNITGWGKYVPEKVLTNEDLAAFLDTSDEWITARTGIKERRIAGPDEHTSTMAARASMAALESARLDPTDLDLIIVATSSPDHHTPPVSSQVQEMIGARDVGAMQMVVGCPGWVYALVTAHQFIATGAMKNILVVGVELISRYLDWEDRNTCVLFGDGAGAVVLQATEEPAGVLAFELGSDGSGAEHLIVPAGAIAQPPSHEAIDNRDIYLKMNGREVFKFATRVMVDSLHRTLGQAGLTPDDVDLFIPHQANARIIEAATRAAGLSSDKVFLNVERYGNTSAASIPISFCDAFEAGLIRPGSVLAFVSFGAGLTWAATLFRLGETVTPGWKQAMEAAVPLA